MKTRRFFATLMAIVMIFGVVACNPEPTALPKHTQRLIATL